MNTFNVKIPSVVWWHSNDGQRMALVVKVTPRYTFLVLLDEGRGVVLKRVPNEETEPKSARVTRIRLRSALIDGEGYPIRKAVAHYRRMGKSWGISGAAVEALKEVSK